MKALVWHGPEQLRTEGVAEPVPRAGEVVLRVDAAGICGSEIEGYLGRMPNRVPPLIMGHEFAGTVSRVGPSVDEGWVGRAVAVNPLLSCGECLPCASGRRNVCERRRLVGIHRPGGFAEAATVPVSTLVPLPEGLDPRLGALAEPLANGVHAVALGSLRGPAAAAIIIGAGTIGLAALQAALLSGIPRVTVAEPHELRRGQAAALGAHHTSASADDLPPASADLVIDAVGRAETRARAVELTRSAGVFVAIGLHSEASVVSFGDVIRREIAVQGSYGYTDHEFGRALEWLAAGRAGIGPLEPLLPLDAGPAAFAELARGPTGHIKVFLGGAG